MKWDYIYNTGMALKEESEGPYLLECGKEVLNFGGGFESRL